MQLKSSYITVIIILLIVSLPLISLSADLSNNKTLKPVFPSLIESIRFNTDIKYCGIRIPLDQQDVKQRLEKEMLLALWNRPQVILWMKRSGKFFPIVERILKEYGLHPDLKYVPLIESALRPHASSSKGAVGYWQFLKSTGKRYGLRIDSKVDERRNIFESTRAACKYLKSLKEEFGSYLLALSAYNMGEYGLKGEIDIQNNKDFFTLYLPLQTQRYAFKIISAKLIFENPGSYGFNLKKTDLYPPFTYDRVSFTINFQIPIALVAGAARIPFKMIKDFNPELRGYHLGKGNINILVPKGKAKGFQGRFASQYKNWERTYKKRFHIVKGGESLIGIAKTYHMSLSSLLRLNNLSIKGMIHPGDRLVVE